MTNIKLEVYQTSCQDKKTTMN